MTVASALVGDGGAVTTWKRPTCCAPAGAALLAIKAAKTAMVRIFMISPWLSRGRVYHLAERRPQRVGGRRCIKRGPIGAIGRRQNFPLAAAGKGGGRQGPLLPRRLPPARRRSGAVSLIHDAPAPAAAVLRGGESGLPAGGPPWLARFGQERRPFEPRRGKTAVPKTPRGGSAGSGVST